MTQAAAAPMKPASATASVTAVATKKAVANRPKASVMVCSAIKALNERSGSSLTAIKKTIASTHQVDVAKLAPFIRRAIKTGVASGTLVQTKGTGASGSFKLAPAGARAKSGNKIVEKPAKTTTKPAKASVKKSLNGKKSSVKKTGASPKKSMSVGAAKKLTSKKTTATKKPSRAKKTTTISNAVKKPRARKPKKSTTTKSVTK